STIEVSFHPREKGKRKAAIDGPLSQVFFFFFFFFCRRQGTRGKSSSNVKISYGESSPSSLHPHDLLLHRHHVLVSSITAGRGGRRVADAE
ncbi:unnamed protein product, partial [Musa acuminata subsp. burmannicoides]